MNLETVIAEKVHALPPVKQKKVLEFVEDLTANEINGHQSPENQNTETPHKSKRYSFIGIGESEKGDLSQKVDEYLAEAANKQEGWSLPK